MQGKGRSGLIFKSTCIEALLTVTEADVVSGPRDVSQTHEPQPLQRTSKRGLVYGTVAGSEAAFHQFCGTLTSSREEVYRGECCCRLRIEVWQH